MSTGCWSFDAALLSGLRESGRIASLYLGSNESGGWTLSLHDDEVFLQRAHHGPRIIQVPMSTEMDREHNIMVTREAPGQWELFVDGESVGTAYDPFSPTGPTEVIVYHHGRASFDNIVFTQR
jgi:hypothetical protein